MRSLHKPILFLLLVSLVILSNFPLSVSKVTVSNILKSSDHIGLSSTRVVIDDAISERQRRGLMELIHSLPQFQTNNPVTLRFNSTIKYAFQDVGELIHRTNVNVTQVQRASNSASKIHFSSALERNLQWMRLLMEVEVQIIEYAEAYFNLSLTKFNSALFYRGHTELDGPSEKSLAEFNNGSGWLVPIHVDNCQFDTSVWRCIRGVDRLFQKQFSAVLFLNDLSHRDAGGEFVFLDSTRQLAGGLTPAMEAEFEAQRTPEGYNRQRRSRDLKQAGEDVTEGASVDSAQAAASYYEHLHASEGPSDFSIPPPSRAQIRRALAQEQRRRQHHMHRTLGDSTDTEDTRVEEQELVTASTKYSKTVTVSSVGVNYTVVFPHAGRLAIFNSSVENIHAVTQILKENDKRFTLFMFLRVRTQSI